MIWVAGLARCSRLAKLWLSGLQVCHANSSWPRLIFSCFSFYPISFFYVISFFSSNWIKVSFFDAIIFMTQVTYFFSFIKHACSRWTLFFIYKKIQPRGEALALRRKRQGSSSWTCWSEKRGVMVWCRWSTIKMEGVAAFLPGYLWGGQGCGGLWMGCWCYYGRKMARDELKKVSYQWEVEERW